MSLRQRVEAQKGIAAREDGTATPVPRPSSSATQILAREDLLHQIRLRLQGEIGKDRKSTRLNSSHIQKSRMPSSA